MNSQVLILFLLRSRRVLEVRSGHVLKGRLGHVQILPCRGLDIGGGESLRSLTMKEEDILLILGALVIF